MFSGVSQNSHVGASGSAGGAPTNPNTQQNQPAVTLPPTSQRVVPADLLRIHTQSVSGSPSRPAVGIGSGVAFFTRDVAKEVRRTAQWLQTRGTAGRKTNSVPAEVVISLPTGPAWIRLDTDYPLNTTEFETRNETSLQKFIAVYLPSPLATLNLDVTHQLGTHLPPNDLYNLSFVNRKLFNSLALHRQAITNATQLARGEAIILPDGQIRQIATTMNPTRFDRALRYIQDLPPKHQKGPLQELVRQAATQAQFGAVFDHLRAQGRLPQLPLPANFAALSPAVQREVEIFSWRLSGGPAAGSMLTTITPQVRDVLLQAYGDLRASLEAGTACPRNFFNARQLLLDNHEVVHYLASLFGAPAGLNTVAARNWLIRGSQRGDFQITPQIYDALSTGHRQEFQQSLPTYNIRMRHADNFANGVWPLNPPTV